MTPLWPEHTGDYCIINLHSYTLSALVGLFKDLYTSDLRTDHGTYRTKIAVN